MTNAQYSIKDLENFTQIKAHTIRIWEQRYGLLEPKRTDTNIRYYSENDLKKILNINLLYSRGYKISKIAAFNEAEIVEAAKSLILVSEKENQSEIDALTVLILQLNGRKIKEILHAELERTDLMETYKTIVLPLLQKLGQLWQVSSIQIIHEHYFSNIFKEFLISRIDQIELTPDPAKNAVLFLHDTEEHEFSILLYYYLLKEHGYTCHYFGQRVPVKDLETAYTQIQPQLVVTTFVAKISEKNFETVHTVLEGFSKKSKVIISGSQLSRIQFPISDSIQQISSLDELNSLFQ